MPKNEIEVRIALDDASPEKIAEIFRFLARQFESGGTRIPIMENGRLAGGAVLDTSDEINKSANYRRMLEWDGSGGQ